MNRSWRNWIPAACLAAMLAASGGCHCCPCLKKNDECISCPTSRFGTVNEDEKGKCKARMNAMIDSWINRDGCSPEDERIPMLKRIADKANRESEIPVIKTAAKIKHEEDMCQQKIKAVKYLAKVGCGCYDKDGEVAKAMLAALNDCLPAVRLTAAQALAGCVCDEPITRPCCTEEIAERLYDMAWGYNDDGSCVEPIFEIRQWAAYAYSMCPKRAEPTPPPTPVPPVETGNPLPESPAEPTELEQKKDDDAAGLPIPVPQKSASITGQWRSPKAEPVTNWENRLVVNLKSTDVKLRLATVQMIRKCAQEGHTFDHEQPDVNGETTLTALMSIGFGVDADGNPLEANSDIRQAAVETVELMGVAAPIANADVTQPAAAAETSAADVLTVEIIPGRLTETDDHAPLPAAVAAAPSTTNLRLAPATSAPVQAATVSAQPSVPLDGVVESVDVAGETAIVRLTKLATPARNAKVLVRHRYILGRLQTIGEFEVTDVAPGMATIRPVAGTSIRKISTGDAATVLGQ